MRPRTLVILGLAIWILSIPYFVLALQAGVGDEIAESLCPDSCRGADLAVEIPRRVLREQEGEAITAVLSTTGQEAHAVEVRITAPGFTVSPPETARTVSVAAGQETRVSWVITPQTAGIQSISVGSKDKVYVLGVQVAAIPGLTAQQAQILSYFGIVLGPLLILLAGFTILQARRSARRILSTATHANRPSC
jgi:hypothetical protein